MVIFNRSIDNENDNYINISFCVFFTHLVNNMDRKMLDAT